MSAVATVAPRLDQANGIASLIYLGDVPPTVVSCDDLKSFPRTIPARATCDLDDGIAVGERTILAVLVDDHTPDPCSRREPSGLAARYQTGHRRSVRHSPSADPRKSPIRKLLSNTSIL